MLNNLLCLICIYCIAIEVFLLLQHRYSVQTIILSIISLIIKITSSPVEAPRQNWQNFFFVRDSWQVQFFLLVSQDFFLYSLIYQGIVSALVHHQFTVFWCLFLGLLALQQQINLAKTEQNIKTENAAAPTTNHLHFLS